jgi:flagellar hook-basal body complex protein FliE
MNQTNESIEKAVAQIDLTNVTPSEIIKDVIDASSQWAFRLMVATALLDRITKASEPVITPEG